MLTCNLRGTEGQREKSEKSKRNLDLGENQRDRQREEICVAQLGENNKRPINYRCMAPAHREDQGSAMPLIQSEHWRI